MDIDALIEAANPVSDSTLPRPDSSAARRLYLEVTARPVLPPRRISKIARPAAVASVAAAVAVAIGLAVFGGPGSPGSVPQTSRATTAAQFFQHAAKVVLADAGSVPQVDQYVYIETKTGTGGTTKTWLSANGTRPGAEAITESQAKTGPSTPVSAIQPCTIAQAQVEACSLPSAGYDPNLPTQPSQILSYLATVHVVPPKPPGNIPESTVQSWNDNDLAKMVDWLFTNSYLTPAQQAAVYKLMAQTAGFSVVTGLADALGRSGVGIEWDYEGGYGALIFNPTTYAFLGMRTWPTGQPPNPSAPYDGSALAAVAIVNQVGQTP